MKGIYLHDFPDQDILLIEQRVARQHYEETGQQLAPITLAARRNQVLKSLAHSLASSERIGCFGYITNNPELLDKCPDAHWSFRSFQGRVFVFANPKEVEAYAKQHAKAMSIERVY